MENMFDLMEERVEVEDRPLAIDMVNKSSSSSRPPDIEFRDVSFGYLADRQILEEVSFRISPGTSLAIVGSSGSGKSTIARLLFRLFDVDSGSVLVNGVDVR
jgi:ABC-type multidrug transport system fused ATPase/permease subunit